MKPNRRILVAGIGNIFWGDDAFGVEVAQRLTQRDWPAGVVVVDFGIRGLDFAYALLENYDAVILIDATQRGGEPGSLYVIEPDINQVETGEDQPLQFEAHGMVPDKSLRWAQVMGARCPFVRLVGCEPETVGSEDNMIMGLSQPVQAAIAEASRIVEQLVDEILDEQHEVVT